MLQPLYKRLGQGLGGACFLGEANLAMLSHNDICSVTDAIGDRHGLSASGPARPAGLDVTACWSCTRHVEGMGRIVGVSR